MDKRARCNLLLLALLLQLPPSSSCFCCCCFGGTGSDVTGCQLKRSREEAEAAASALTL